MINDLDRRGMGGNLYGIEPAIITISKTADSSVPVNWDGDLSIEASSVITNTKNLDITITNRKFIIPEGYNYCRFWGSTSGIGGNRSSSVEFPSWVLYPTVNGVTYNRFGDTNFGNYGVGFTHYVHTMPLTFKCNTGDGIALHFINSTVACTLYGVGLEIELYNI